MVEFILVLMTYFTLGTLLAILSRRFFRANLTDYYIAGSRLGGLLSAGTYAATTYSTFMMVGLVGMTYATGIGALGFELVYLASTVFLLSTVGMRIWMLSRGKQWISPSHMLGELYNSKLLAVITSLIYTFAMIPYLSAQIQGLKAIFGFGGFTESEALIFSAIAIYVWIAIAGMWSVAVTDFYQSVIMFACGICYLMWVALQLVPSSGALYSDLLEALINHKYLGLTGFWAPSVFLAYTIPWAFFAVTNPQVVVRLYLHKDIKAYRRSVVLFFIYGFTYTLIVVVVGLLAAGLSRLGLFPMDLPWDSVTPHLLNSMHPLLGSLIAVSIIAAGISTSNSIVLAVSGSILSTSRRLNRLMLARALDAILVIVATLVASMRAGFIVDLSVLTSVILLPLAPLTILATYRSKCFSKYSRYSAIASVLFGVGLATYYATILGPRRAFRELLAGMPLSLWVLLTSTLIVLPGYIVDRFKLIAKANL